MRLLRVLTLSCLLSLPAMAQFSIVVQQNGQATAVTNGATLTMNAAGVGQNASATVTLTYLGAGAASFAMPGQVLGNNFAVTGGINAAGLNSGESTTFTFTYSAQSTAQALGEFTWPFTQIVNGTVVASGAVTFNLAGTAPNFNVGQVPAAGAFVPIASGGTIQLPSTLVGATSTVTLGIINSGSGSGPVASISSSGAAYQLSGVPLLPGTLTAGSQLNITVQFTPQAAGVAAGSVQLVLGGATYTVLLTGTGVSSLITYSLTQDGTTSAVSPGQTITLDSTNLGSSSSAVIQFQNTGTVSAVINTLGINGPGFAITSQPFFPLTLQPQQSNSITITYTPTVPGASLGHLLIGTDSFSLASTGLGPLLQYSYQQGSVNTTVVSGNTVVFSPLAVGQTESIHFAISNAGTATASVTSISLPAGSVYQLAGIPPLPLQVAPKAVVSFSITFAPLTAGQLTAVLLIDTQTFTLSGVASAPAVPPLPGYQFTGASGVQQPFQQPAMGLSLASPYPVALTGTLTMAITPANAYIDPAVQFSSGGRTVAFTIAANTLQATFPDGTNQIRLQTGTVAGTIQITPAFATAVGATNVTPTNPTVLSLSVPSLAPALLTAVLSARTLTGFTITVTGYTTTRYMSNVKIQFTPSSGAALSATNLTEDLSAGAIAWYPSAAAQPLGGQFTIDLAFTLASSTTVAAGTDLTKNINQVSVTVANDIGTSASLQVALP